MGEANDFLDWIDRPYRIRGITHGHQLRLGTDLSSKVGHIEGAVLLANLCPANSDTALCQRQPWRDVGVVIEACYQDLIARPEIATDGSTDRKGERSHVRTKDNLVCAAVEKIGHGGTRTRDHRVGMATSGIGSAGVGIVAAQVFSDGVNHPLRHLRAAGAVQKCCWIAIYGLS